VQTRWTQRAENPARSAGVAQTGQWADISALHSTSGCWLRSRSKRALEMA
jgi:hypothetical protein